MFVLPGRNLVEFILTILPFILGILIFILYIYIQSVIKRNGETLNLQSKHLRQIQNQIRGLILDSEMYAESDPEPYGSLKIQINEDLILCSKYILEINNLYSRNKTLHRKISHPEFGNITRWFSFWRDYHYGMQKLTQLNASISLLILKISDHVEKLTRITDEVAEKSKKLIDRINLIKIKIHELEELNISDEEFVRVSKSLDQWEQTALHQIPIIFISGEQGLEYNQIEKFLVAKVLRLVNKIEPEINLVDSRVSTWESDYQTIEILKSKIKTAHECILQTLKLLSDNPVLSVDCENIATVFLEATMEFEELKNIPTVSDFPNHLVKLEGIYLIYSDSHIQVNQLNLYQNELIERIKKRQPYHRLEWVKNAQKIMEDAREYNLENWPADIKIVDLKQKLSTLLAHQTKIIPVISSTSISADKLEKLHKTISNLDEEYEALSLIFKKYFNRLREIQELEDDFNNQLSQFYSALKLLNEVASTNPSIKRENKNKLNDYLGKIEGLNQLLSEKDVGRIELKFKKWNALSLKITQTIKNIGKKMLEENNILSSKLLDQINILQDYLAMNEPVFFSALASIKNETVGKGNLQFSELNVPVLELVQQIKNLSQNWHQLTASTNALGDILNPVTDRLEKLGKIRNEVLKLMQEGDSELPDTISWPPTTKIITKEREKFSIFEENFILLKTQKSTAIQLITKLSDLTDNYKDLSIHLKNILADAGVERKKFYDLEKRLNQSVSMWQNITKSHHDNLLLVGNIQEFLESVNKDYMELKKRYSEGRIPYSQAFQMFRLICRRIDQESVEFDNSRVINISGEVHQKL